jgi:hypothetical protein
MKKTLLFLSVILIAVLVFSINWAVSNSNAPERETPKFDTRIDNIQYWVKMAKKGYTPFNPDIKVKTAVFKGSEINARTVATEDSPDVPVTEVNSTQSENSIFIHPANVETVLNSNNSTPWPVSGIYGANDFYSFDIGETWGGEVEGAGGENSGDPTTAIGLNGRWYVNYISDPGGQGVSYSDDEGETWTARIIAPNPGQLADKNHMWIDNSVDSDYEGNLYAAWTDFGGPNYGNIVLSYSTDHGVNWSPIQNISADNSGFHQGVHIQTGPNGEVYAFYCVYGSGDGMEAIGMSKSLDGGETWEASKIITNLRGAREASPVKTIRMNDFPVSATDISYGEYRGNIYVTWANIGVPGINVGNDIDIYMIRSSDVGETWTEQIKINQDPAGQGKVHFFPWISCDPTTGSLAAIFYDDRNAEPDELETWCANSIDAGDTWEDFRVSDVAFTPAPIPGLASNYMGDYLGIASRDGFVYPTFTDNRSGVTMTYCSPYKFNALKYPKNLTGQVMFETGNSELEWNFETAEGFLYFNVYRDGELLGNTTDTTYTDLLPTYGYYYYQVTAMYEDDLESSPTGLNLQWGDAHIAINPESVYEHLTVDSSSKKYLTVTNTGQLPLAYELTTYQPEEKSPAAYCDASGGGSAEFIKIVDFGDIQNVTGYTAYSDFTSQSTNLDVGKTYEFYVTVGEYFLQDQCGAWIDWNQDEVFDEEIIPFEVIPDPTDPDTAVFKAIVTVPLGVPTGSTRLRVRLRYTGDLNPCGTTNWGEVEDYTVNVQNWLGISPVNGTVQPGETSQIQVDFSSMGIAPGMYYATALFSSNDPNAQELAVPLTLEVSETLVSAEVEKPGTFCFGETFNLSATPYGNFSTPTFTWMSIPEGFTSDEQNPEVVAETSSWYFVEMVSATDTFFDSVFVEVMPLPEVNLGADTSYCGGVEIMLDAGNEGVKYLWSTGDTTKTIAVDTTTLFSGYGERTLSVQVYGANQCVNHDTISVTYVNCTGIEENNNNLSLTVFPNPGHGVFNLDLNAVEDDVINIRVVNQIGAVIFQQDQIKIKGDKKLKINLENYGSGVYQLFIQGKNSAIGKKIIIK